MLAHKRLGSGGWVNRKEACSSLFDGSNPLLIIAALIEEWASRSLLENGTNASFSIQKDCIGKFDSRPHRIYYLYKIPIVCVSLRIVAFIPSTHSECQNSLVDYRKQNATREICREVSSKCHQACLSSAYKNQIFPWLRLWLRMAYRMEVWYEPSNAPRNVLHSPMVQCN